MSRVVVSQEHAAWPCTSVQTCVAISAADWCCCCQSVLLQSGCHLQAIFWSVLCYSSCAASWQTPCLEV